ncbi:Mucosa-associated lymphoid tissue lymphoma translocation protein 1-like [Homarus americanus]|uniref:Mucosa-associated lymphoid tissue lymphoma translocation protein 1-like n=1 Tax=Homarus americanus TaxID=6706 RepID=A0A8J5ML10_HOMAM|nr:Mucosa-associated lymphoid tissue lymphoma translocation protein 1-like [Homarus americanus]
MTSRVNMADSELQPDTPLQELSYKRSLAIVSAFNENNNWKNVAGKLDIVLSHQEILQNPGQALFRKLIYQDFTVEHLQILLGLCELYDILNELVTNVPVMIKPPEYSCKEVKLGKSITINVDVDGSPYPEFQWYFMDSDNPLDGQTTCSLTIDKFKIQDKGEYFCKVRQILKGNVRELCSDKVTLNVERMNPMISENLSDMKFYAGEELVLTCAVIGYPEPNNYRWFKNNEVFKVTSQPILKIPREDSLVPGAYKFFFEVWNDLGSCKSEVATVTVVPPIPPTITKQPRRKSKFGLDRFINLSFEVHCRNEVKFICFVNNKPLDSAGSFHGIIESKSLSDNIHTCDLFYSTTKENMQREEWKPLLFRFEAASPTGRVSSDDIVIQVKQTQEETLTARNKWALLVANSDYKTEDKELYAPLSDVKLLARELTKLQFRIIMYSNLEKADFFNAFHHFSTYVQEGDYVVFYFAGHGFSCDGIDFMVPVDNIHTGSETDIMKPLNMDYENIPREENVKTSSDLADGIALTNFINSLQHSRPELLFQIIDACRGQVYRVISTDATTNQVFANAHICAFRRYSHEEDVNEYGVLRRWERLGRVECFEAKMQVAHCDIRVKVQCTQEELPDYQHYQKKEPVRVISNNIQVNIVLMQGDAPFDTRVINKEGLDLHIKFSTGQNVSTSIPRLTFNHLLIFRFSDIKFLTPFFLFNN